jgi:hypothetical protein
MVTVLSCAWLAHAQPAAPADPAAPTERLTPVLSVSAGVGAIQFQGRWVTMVPAAVEIGITRHASVEAEVVRWVSPDAPGFQFDGRQAFEIGRRETTIAGANLFFRAGWRRLSGFAGGGLGAHVIRERFERPVDSVGRLVGDPAFGSVRSTELGLQVVGGAELALTSRVRTFVGLRGQLRPDPNVGVSAGVRVVLRTRRGETRPALDASGRSQSIGRAVTVIGMDGRRRGGRLVSLSDAEVVIAGAAVARIPLSGVERIERQAHWARNLSLAGAAFFGGVALGYCANDCGAEGLSILLVEAAIAAGAGLGIGAMINAATSDGRTIYRRPGTSRGITLAPAVAPRRIALGVRARW